MRSFLAITFRTAALFLLCVATLSCTSFSKRSGGFLDRGTASWYGTRFQGKKTASGERYDMYEYTAAHRTLPFGTRVKVKSMASGKTVTVRINDRGPYSGGRILDLSYAAARDMGMIQKGMDEIEIYVLPGNL